MVDGLTGEEHRIFDEDECCSEDEGEKELDVDVVPGTVQFSKKEREREMDELKK